MSQPIPAIHLNEFVGYMDAADIDDLPDGAWFQNLVDSAERFMADKGIKGSAHDAALQYTAQQD